MMRAYKDENHPMTQDDFHKILDYSKVDHLTLSI